MHPKKAALIIAIGVRDKHRKKMAHGGASKSDPTLEQDVNDTIENLKRKNIQEKAPIDKYWDKRDPTDPKYINRLPIRKAAKGGEVGPQDTVEVGGHFMPKKEECGYILEGERRPESKHNEGEAPKLSEGGKIGLAERVYQRLKAKAKRGE